LVGHVKKVEEPVRDRPALIHRPERAIDVLNLFDTEETVQRRFEGRGNTKRQERRNYGMKCRGYHHLLNPRLRRIYSAYRVSRPDERTRRPRIVMGSATWSSSADFQLASSSVPV